MSAARKTLIILLSISAWFSTRAGGGIFTNNRARENTLVDSAPACLVTFGFVVPLFDAGAGAAGAKAESDKPATVGRPALPSGRVYYVDSEKGKDQNLGTTPQEAWRSIMRANETDFAPGDQLLFAGGQGFGGTLRFGKKCRGTKDRPILISSFGQGRATIKPDAADGLVLMDCEYVVIKEINVVGCGRKNGSNGTGIKLIRTRHVNLDAIEVSGFRESGVGTGGDQNTRMTYVYAHDNGSGGIIAYGGHEGIPRVRDLTIGYCVAENNPGDPQNLTNHSGNGILVGGVDNALIEYCQAMNNGWDMPRKGNGPVGIWAWDCDRVVIQHCISHDNKTAAGAYDGGGFDLDGHVTRSILQYNLSYNNHGCGYLLYHGEDEGGKLWKDNICRYNISVHDGLTNHFSGINLGASARGMSDAQIYNNLIINTRCAIRSESPGIKGLVFRNNILIADQAVIVGPLHQAVFEGNLYCKSANGVVFRDREEVFKTLADWARASGKEMIDGRMGGLAQDPKLVMPAHLRELPTDPAQLKAMPFYRVRADSPCVGGGVVIRENGERDFFGNPVDIDRRPTLGVHEPTR